MAKTSTKASAKAVDFSNVKDRGNFNPQRAEAGDYIAKVTKVGDAESKSDGNFQYVFTIKLQKFSQYSYPYYCKLQENQLWKLRNLLIAAGLNVPKARMKLDPNKVVGRTIGVTLEDDEYDGKEKSTIAAIFPASELADIDDEPADEPDEDEDEAEEEAPKAKKKKAKAEPEDDDEPDEAPKAKKKGKKKKSAEVEELDLDEI